MNWVIADPHFYHYNIIGYCNRPFKTAEEMNEVILHNINSTCAEHDTLWILGDFAYGRGSKEHIEEMARRILPDIVLFKGNHDHETANWYLRRGFWKVLGGMYYEYEPGVLLSHMPYPVKPPIINIYGHVHDIISIRQENYACVSVEQIDYTPVNLDELIRVMKHKYNR